MNNELKKIDELYDIILSNKKIIHEQIAKGVTNMFGNSKVVVDKTSEGAVPPKGWKPGYKFIIQNSADVFSPVEGTVEQISSNNGKFYVYISSNGNQIYVGNLNSSNLSKGATIKIRDKIGSVNSGSFVYVASNPTAISSIVDVSGNITNTTGIDLFSNNNKGVNLTAKMIGNAIRSQNESLTKNRKKIINEVLVKISDVESQYPNIKFANRTLNDSLNKALLDDINSAAGSIGAVVTVDYAKFGHHMYVDGKPGVISRHWRQLAVDIDYIIIGGKTYAVSLENREIVEKFTDVLKSMGYNKNSEGDDNPKAFLTFGAGGHDTHVHVSNTTGASTGIPNFPTIPDIDPTDGFEEILNKTVFKGMTPLEKAAAIKKLKDAGIWAAIVAAGAGVVSLIPFISKILKSGVEKVTDDTGYGGKQPQVNRTAKYIGNLLRLALPF